MDDLFVRCAWAPFLHTSNWKSPWNQGVRLILFGVLLFFFLIYFCTKSHAHKKIFSESTKVVTDASMGLSPVAQNPSKLIWNVNYCFSNVRFWQKTNKIYIMNSICWFGTSFYLDNDQNWAYNIYLLFRYNYSTMVLR